MALNAEEKMEHEKFKQKQYSRPTEEQIKIAQLEMKVFELEKDLQSSRNTNNRFNDTVDRLVAQRDLVNHHMSLYDSHERKAGVTLDSIRAVLM